MLRAAKDLQDLDIVARDADADGTIGDVKDLYFYDEAWTIRCLGIETGSWLLSRKVLISPISTGTPDWTPELLPVSLTREQVNGSPDIDTDMPVTQQHEADYFDHYRDPYCWGGAGSWGRSGNPPMPLPGHAGYGEIGHVLGLLVDEDSWAIRDLLVSIGNWWGGHAVLVAPQWTQRVSWATQTVAVALTREATKQAPWYDPALPLSCETEIAIYTHYGRAACWSDAETGSQRAAPPPAA